LKRKLRWPETEETLTAGRVVIPDDENHRAANALHAFANGAWLGLKIAGMILSTLLCIIAFVALINGLLTWWGRYLNIGGADDDPYNLTIQLILGYVFYPIAFLLGVSREGDDLIKVSQLIGIKISLNEYAAFTVFYPRCLSMVNQADLGTRTESATGSCVRESVASQSAHRHVCGLRFWKFR